MVILALKIVFRGFSSKEKIVYQMTIQITSRNMNLFHVYNYL